MTTSQNVFAGQGSDTRHLPLAQVASSVRRNVAIYPAFTYIESGVRSFHKGNFRRRSLTGDLGTSKTR